MKNLRIHTFAAVPFSLPLHFSALPAQPGGAEDSTEVGSKRHQGFTIGGQEGGGQA